MTLQRAKEIQSRISEAEERGLVDIDTFNCDEYGWVLFAREIGATVEELDEFITLELMGCLDSADDWPDERPRSALGFPYEPLRDDEAEDDPIGRRCQHADSYF